MLTREVMFALWRITLIVLGFVFLVVLIGLGRYVHNLTDSTILIMLISGLLVLGVSLFNYKYLGKLDEYVDKKIRKKDIYDEIFSTNNIRKNMSSTIMGLQILSVFVVGFSVITVRYLFYWIEEEKLSYATPIDYGYGGYLAVFLAFSIGLFINLRDEYKKYKVYEQSLKNEIDFLESKKEA